MNGLLILLATLNFALLCCSHVILVIVLRRHYDAVTINATMTIIVGIVK